MWCFASWELGCHRLHFIRKKMITVTEADMFLQPDQEICENFQ